MLSYNAYRMKLWARQGRIAALEAHHRRRSIEKLVAFRRDPQDRVVRSDYPWMILLFFLLPVLRAYRLGVATLALGLNHLFVVTINHRFPWHIGQFMG